MARFEIHLTPDDNDTLMVRCPALPEVITYGETVEAARRHAIGAIEEAVAARLAGGVALPLVDDLRSEPAGLQVEFVDVAIPQSLGTA